MSNHPELTSLEVSIEKALLRSLEQAKELKTSDVEPIIRKGVLAKEILALYNLIIGSKLRDNFQGLRTAVHTSKEALVDLEVKTDQATMLIDNLLAHIYTQEQTHSPCLDLNSQAVE